MGRSRKTDRLKTDFSGIRASRFAPLVVFICQVDAARRRVPVRLDWKLAQTFSNASISALHGVSK